MTRNRTSVCGNLIPDTKDSLMKLPKNFLCVSLISSAAAFICSSANAGFLAFSFADPVPGKQFSNNQNNAYGAGTGQMSYDKTAVISFLVDGSGEANPFTYTFTNARMEMDMALYTGSTVGGVFVAPVVGYFNIYDATSGNSILKGTASGGAFLRIGGTGSILLSDSMGLSYSFGSELLTLLATTGNFSTGPANPQEGVFTLTDATTLTGGPLISTGGVVNSFSANASYSGNTMTPSPGAIALLGLAGLMVRRRSH